MMVFSLSTNAKAEGTKGTITINNAINGQDYSIYKIMDLESYDKDEGLYSYKPASPEWENFFNLRTPVYEINLDKNLVTFKPREEVSTFLKEKGIDTSKWTEEKWQSINTSQAEIHIQALAESMWDAMNKSTPKELKEGEFHLPFIKIEEDLEITK